MICFTGFFSRFYVVSVVSRGRALAAQATNSTIDRQLEAKLAWIAECERSLDALENEAHRFGSNPQRDSTGNTLQRLKVCQNYLFFKTTLYGVIVRKKSDWKINVNQ